MARLSSALVRFHTPVLYAALLATWVLPAGVAESAVGVVGLVVAGVGIGVSASGFVVREQVRDLERDNERLLEINRRMVMKARRGYL